MSEPLEVAFGKMTVRIEMILSALAEAKAESKKLDGQLTEMRDVVQSMERRLHKVETQWTAVQPVIEGVVDLKKQIHAFGMFGKWTWAAIGTVISTAYLLREHIRNFFMGGP